MLSLKWIGKVVRSHGIGKGAVKIERFPTGHLSISIYRFIRCGTGVMYETHIVLTYDQR
jgi:hypothetical protein